MAAQVVETTQRSLEVYEFLSAGGSVCPFAKKAEGFKIVEVEDPPKHMDLFDMVGRFGRTKGAIPASALIVVGPYDEDYTKVKSWAVDTYCDLNALFVVQDNVGMSYSEVRGLVEREVRPVLLNDADPRRPNIICRNERLITICMSPVYPKKHPRYSPHTMLVLTWNSDIARGQEVPGLVPRLRRVMVEQHGSLYDADELMLKLPA